MRSVGELARLLGGRPGQMSTSGDVVILTADEAEEVLRDLRESAQESARLAAAREADRQSAWIASRRDSDGVGSVAQSGPRDASTSGGQAQTREVVMSEAKPTSDDQSRNQTAPDAHIVGGAQAEAAARAVYGRHGHVAPWDEADEVLRGMYIAEQRAALEAAGAERDRLREALEFYADRDNYDVYCAIRNPFEVRRGYDVGRIARAALGVSDER